MLASVFRRRHLLAGLVLLALGGSPVLAEDGPYVDVLGAPGPIRFEGVDYALSWTSHPLENFYKQEYLPAGQNSDSYTAMLMLDVTSRGQTVDNAIAGYIKGLEERKASDPLVSYKVIHNATTGETILDCVLSDGSGDNIVVEWDAYRYTTFGGGIAVFAISKRAYGSDAEAFMTNLAQARKGTIKALAAMDLPKLTLDD